MEQGRMRQQEDTPGENVQTEERMDRRAMLTKGAALAAGVLVAATPGTAAALTSERLTIERGKPLLSGVDNVCNYKTRLMASDLKSQACFMTLGCGVVGSTASYRDSSSAGVFGMSSDARAPGVLGRAGSESGIGVKGKSTTNAGVRGESSQGPGLMGTSASGAGVQADGGGMGVYGGSVNGPGVFGHSTKAPAVKGMSADSQGVYGTSTTSDGILGTVSSAQAGVSGNNDATGPGVIGRSLSGAGVRGETSAADSYGVVGQNASGGVAIRGVGSSATGRGAVEGHCTAEGPGVLGTSTGGPGVAGRSSGLSDGVTGWNESEGTGVRGSSSSGNGVLGETSGTLGVGVAGSNFSDGIGVRGLSPSGKGVYGESAAATGVGVTGYNTAERGISVLGDAPARGVGVKGSAGADVAGAAGVLGMALEDTSTAVAGLHAQGGLGVWGKSTTGAGVKGECTGAGIGVLAESASGMALDVRGKAHFSNAGVEVIAVDSQSATVTTTETIADRSLILVTLRDNPGEGVSVQYAKRTSATSFDVFLNMAAAVDTPFSWFIVN